MASFASTTWSGPTTLTTSRRGGPRSAGRSSKPGPPTITYRTCKSHTRMTSRRSAHLEAGDETFELPDLSGRAAGVVAGRNVGIDEHDAAGLHDLHEGRFELLAYRPNERCFLVG